MNRIIASYLQRFVTEHSLSDLKEEDQFERFVNFCLVSQVYPGESGVRVQFYPRKWGRENMGRSALFLKNVHADPSSGVHKGNFKMLKSIKMRDVATFPDSDLLIPLSKRVALFYGHNGSGKSTIARALKKQEGEFSKCSLLDDGAGPYQILVYNADYIDQTFYGDNAFPGIFTLGEENKEAND